MATKVLEKSLKRECINTGNKGPREQGNEKAGTEGPREGKSVGRAGRFFVSGKEGLPVNGTRFY
jgi:hypothetical protein